MSNPENPKERYGIIKPCIQFIPPSAILEEAVVMALGAKKYGPFNWYKNPVRATTYYSAAFRHMAEWYSGQNIDPQSGAHHLAHVRSCMGILIDASMAGCLIDDRPSGMPNMSNLIQHLSKDIENG